MKNKSNYKLIISEEKQGIRLDMVLSISMENTSRNFVQKLIEGGKVSLNGKNCKSKKIKVKAGDLIEVIIPEPETLSVKSENIPLEIVYEDDDVLVVNKPRGMVVHPAIGNLDGTLVNAIMYHCGDRLSSINGIIRPGIVHRIDKDTSGLLMIAKNDRAHNHLAKQLADHSSKRAYKAIVYNNLKEDKGQIDKPIGRDFRNRMKQAVTDLNSKKAITNYKILERLGKFCLIEARLETGRTHQIRVHMAYINHPLLGDVLYGPAKNQFGIEGQMLHAYLLGFVHPTTEKYMEFTVEPPKLFQDTLEKIRENK